MKNDRAPQQTAKTVTTATTDIEIPFEHRKTTHCESGVISSLLHHHELPISEPMAFGISASLSFAYVPLIKFHGLPLLAYRMPPTSIIKGLCKRLGITMTYETYNSPDAGMQALDDHLAAGRVVGLQTSGFWLSYVPPDMRVNFNAHNLVVHGKKRNHYLISDPLMDSHVECDFESLKKSRFVKDALAHKGLLYYPRRIPKTVDLPKAIKSAIRYNTGMMLNTPIPSVGVRGIRAVSRKLRHLRPARLKYNKLFIGHMVRMQEDIGTGGAGFRFLYAAFLQEASTLLNHSGLAESAVEFIAAGDEWRRFGLLAVKMCKDRIPMDYSALADQLLKCAELEEIAYRKLRKQV